MQSENASSRPDWRRCYHSFTALASFEIEMPVSVWVSLGILERYRLVPLPPLWLLVHLSYDRDQGPSLILIVVPNKPGQ